MSSELVEGALACTPARVLVGRAGTGYRTATWLKLREDHAAARDAVHAELNLQRDFDPELVERFGLFGVTTQVSSRPEYLRRPDLGRRISLRSREAIQTACSKCMDLQVVIGDGLSASAVVAQVPNLLPLLMEKTTARGWSVGRPFVVHQCRVGVMNDIGELLEPEVVVLLIGERPGLATAESLSAYLAYRPRPGHTDAQRNLVSNIHAQGVPHADAVERILALAEQFRRLGRSGVGVVETL